MVSEAAQTKPRRPLGKLLLTVTLGAGCLGALLVWLVSYQFSRNQVRELTGAYLVNVGYTFASGLQADMRNRDLENVEATIRRASSSGVANTAVLLDQDNEVLYSTIQNLVGRGMQETPFAIAAELTESARTSMQAVSVLSENGENLIVLIPVRLWPEEGQLISLSTGLLALSFDIKPWLALTASSVFTQAFVFLLFAAGLSVLIAWLLGSQVSRRVGKLVSATRQIAEGNFETKTDVSGQDEIATLSQAIQSMSQQLRTSMSDLAESEDLLLRIINHSPEAIYLSTPAGKLLLMNQVFRQWMGIDEDRPDDVHTSEELQQALAEMNQEVVNGCSETERELVLPCSDGTSRLVRFKKFPVRDSDGQLAGVGTIGNDVTTQRDTENKLRHAQKMEAVGQLTGGLAHDFNNILQAIIGNLELIEYNQSEASETRLFLNEAIEAAERGSRLTQRLLATSRRQLLQPEVLNLNAVITSMQELIRSSVGEQVKLIYRCADDLWNCEVDVSQLENAVLNLAINARDAMPSGGSLILETTNVTLPSRSGLPAGDYVTLSARDTGHGMTDRIRERAFEPFFSTKNEGGGSGLGLSTIYGFVEQSGGQVSLTSSIGAGTTVKLLLPRSREKIASQSAPDAGVTPEGGSEPVLVVEDNAQVRKLTLTMLADLGYSPVAAETGQQALRVMEQRSDIKLVLSDVILPGGMTGLEMAEQILARWPDAQIQLMSGFVADALDQGWPDGLPAPLSKPFKKSEIAIALARLRSTMPASENSVSA